jgi:hypothetical protein
MLRRAQYLRRVPAPRERKGLSANALLGFGVGACALLIVVAVVSLRFLQRTPPPLPPAPPPPPEQNVGRILRYSEPYYKSVLDEDVKRYRVAPVEPAVLAQPLPYAAELTEPRRLKTDRDLVETPHLKITTRVVREWAATSSGQRFRYEHILLSITNRSSRALAYLVDTDVSHPDQCQSQGAMAHNAIALEPGETVQRTECLWHRDTALTLRRVEVMELPALSYYYVSRLSPIQISLDPRTAAGHQVPAPAKECSFVPWRDIQASATEAHTGWSDVIDFYARHNCDEYSFFRGYRRWTSADALPAKAPVAAASGDRVDHPAASK